MNWTGVYFEHIVSEVLLRESDFIPGLKIPTDRIVEGGRILNNGTGSYGPTILYVCVGGGGFQNPRLSSAGVREGQR